MGLDPLVLVTALASDGSHLCHHIGRYAQVRRWTFHQSWTCLSPTVYLPVDMKSKSNMSLADREWEWASKFMAHLEQRTTASINLLLQQTRSCRREGLRSTQTHHAINPTSNIQHSTFNIQHSTFNIQHSTFNIQHSTFKIPLGHPPLKVQASEEGQGLDVFDIVFASASQSGVSI